MKEKTRKVKLLKPFDVDEISIEIDRYFPNAYIVDLPLDSLPDHVWQSIFERKWKSSRHLWDRKLFVIGNKLRLVTTPDDFGEKLDWIEQVMQETNRGVEEHDLAAEMEEEVKMEQELKKQKLWEMKATVEGMKDTLRRKYT
ncbi:MAG: hypothetical protein GWO20_19495 [Candidatus Korarchaeota archaeon]|nr:hypothetical protein [Candidatus Korarchaeota archaeon]